MLLPPQGERFIISECGLCGWTILIFAQGGNGRVTVSSPARAGARGAGFLHEPKPHRVFRPLDFSERLTLNRGYTALLNLRLWEDAERFVVAHPSDRALIENIDNGAQIRLDPSDPYRFRRFSFLGVGPAHAGIRRPVRTRGALITRLGRGAGPRAAAYPGQAGRAGRRMARRRHRITIACITIACRVA